MSLQAKILVTLKSQYRSIAMDDWEMFLTYIYTIYVLYICKLNTYNISGIISHIQSEGFWEGRKLFILFDY